MNSSYFELGQPPATTLFPFFVICSQLGGNPLLSLCRSHYRWCITEYDITIIIIIIIITIIIIIIILIIICILIVPGCSQPGTSQASHMPLASTPCSLLIRPHLIYACFVVSRIIICHIIRHF